MPYRLQKLGCEESIDIRVEMPWARLLIYVLAMVVVIAAFILVDVWIGRLLCLGVGVALSWSGFRSVCRRIRGVPECRVAVDSRFVRVDKNGQEIMFASLDEVESMFAGCDAENTPFFELRLRTGRVVRVDLSDLGPDFYGVLMFLSRALAKRGSVRVSGVERVLQLLIRPRRLH